MILTEAGRNILALALSGYELHFTRAFSGDGSLNNKDPYKLTTLINAKQELAIQSINASATGTCEVVLEMTNKNLSTGYFVREYGLYARHPQTNQEVLYAYENVGDNAGYLEAEDGTHLINYTLSIITVVDQAPNITATITNSNAYVTVTRLDNRIQDLYAGQTSPAGVWTFSPDNDKRLRPLSLNEMKKLLLGVHDINSLISRIERLEDNVGEILLTQEMQGIAPDATHYIIEDFKDINQIDLFECNITSIIAGDDSIDCNPIDGLLPLSYYTITDGIHSENVQIKSINIENGIQRIILMEPIKFTYNLDNCQLFRTSANISGQTAIGPSARKSENWTPNYTWQGQGAKSSFTVAPDISTGNINAFAISGDIAITNDGFITLGA